MSGVYRVEKGKPAPRCRSIYPWAEMQAGDSFFVAADNGRSMQDIRNTLTASGAKWCHRNRPGWKVVTRSENGGVRVWMVEPELGK